MSHNQQTTEDQKPWTGARWWSLAALCLFVPIGGGAVACWMSNHISISLRPRLVQVSGPVAPLPSATAGADAAVVAADASSDQQQPTIRISGESNPAPFQLSAPVDAADVFQLAPASPSDDLQVSTPFAGPPAPSLPGVSLWPSTERAAPRQANSMASASEPTDVTASQLPVETSRHVADIVRAAVGQAEQGALYSARSQLIEGIRAISRALDAKVGGKAHSVALAEALRALDEADDFQFSGMQYEADVAIESFVSGHVTPVLKWAVEADSDSQGLNSVQACEEYYLFAKERLLTASGNAPVAAMAFYALGRVEANLRSSLLRKNGAPREIALYEAALMIEPNHSLAANELGIALARDGQLQLAVRYFQHSAQLSPSPTTLTNLAKVYERLGDHRSQMAVQQQMIAMGPQGVAPGHTAVQLVTMQEFSGSTQQPRAANATSAVPGPVPIPVPVRVQAPARASMQPRLVPAPATVSRPKANADSVWANFQPQN